MRFALDENESPVFVRPLAEVFKPHSFASVQDLGLGGLTDIDLFAALSDSEYDAIITRDKSQLKNQEEWEALFQYNLHWIGYNVPKVKGQDLIVVSLSNLISGLRHIIKVLPEVREASSFKIRGRNHNFDSVINASTIKSRQKIRLSDSGLELRPY